MKIGALNAYHFDEKNPQYQLDYSKLFVEFLFNSLPNTEIKEYKVAQSEIPLSIDECDGWVISGSPKSAYDNEAWILKLKEFIINLNKSKKKLLGICFGHQIIAQALGGKTQKAKSGWGVGVRNFNITKQKPWMTPALKNCHLLFSHQDQVIKLPVDAELLASDKFCPIQMYSIENHIFSFQGHPEFTAEFAKERMDSRKKVIDESTYDKAVNSLNQATSSAIFSKWIKNFFIEQ